MLTDHSLQAKLRKMNFSEVDIFRSEDELIRELIRNNADTNLEDETLRIAGAFDSITAKVAAIEKTAASSAEAEKTKTLNSIRSLEEKLVRLQKRKHETELQQIRKIKEKYFPSGSAQERQENFIPWYLKYGSLFFSELLAVFEPIPKKFLVLQFQVQDPSNK
jgi:uncharacterized protein YllA (UPF0747 family)